jgi:hypothetical protein
MGVLFVGGGFASIYPLVVEKIAHRFPVLPSRLLQRNVLVGHDGRLSCALAARLFAEAWGIQR